MNGATGEPAEGRAPAERAARGGLLAAVFLGGEYGDPAYYRRWVEAAGLIVAADGGARFLLHLGVRADVVVGDFDSLAPADLRRLEAVGVEVVRHPAHKDMTDGELAVDEALRRGAGELVLAGGTGALDHSLGHLAILRRLAACGVAARLVAPQLTMRVLQAPASIALASAAGTRVSLVALGGGALVTLTGLEYPLDHQILPATTCLGLGNCVAAAGEARVTVHEGVVAVLVGSGDEALGAGEAEP